MPIKNISKYKAVIFDFDGTLYYRKGINNKMAFSLLFNLQFLLSYQKARKALFLKDCKNGDNFYRELHRIAASKRFSLIKSKTSFKKRISKGSHWYNRKFYPTFCNILSKDFKAENLVKDLLTKLKKSDVKLICYSDYSFIKERLEAIDISSQIFDIFISSEKEGVLKPSARPVKELCNTYNLRDSEVLIVGDRKDTDGETAKLAGVDFFRIFDQNNKTEYIKSWELLTAELYK